MNTIKIPTKQDFIETGETQAAREARLSKDHGYEDCELGERGVCWICEERGRERTEDIKLQEAKDGRLR